MYSSSHKRTAHADAVADMVCLRRLLHAFLGTIAAWMLCAMLIAVAGEAGEARWWLGGAIVVTTGTSLFAIWSMSLGDRRVWLRAYQAAGERK